MKKILLLVIVTVLAYSFVREQGLSIPAFSQRSQGSDSALLAALENKQSDVQVQGEGVVSRLLPDDNDGSRHQRFIVRLVTGETLLIAHNIDLAPRVTDLDSGDMVEFYGEYEWNSKGGVIHWTHHDPGGRRDGGWIRHAQRTYR